MKIKYLNGSVKEINKLSGANLTEADLTEANLFGANLSRANLTEADLSRANLSEANLFGANLTEASLSGANLTGANLTEADLTEANLFGANLFGANLSGASLSGANLFGTEGLIDCGNPHGYQIYVVQHKDGIRIKAGCRWMTWKEANLYWKEQGDKKLLSKPLLTYIKSIAKVKGWKL